MEVLVGGDHHRGHFRALDEFVEIGGNEVRTDFFGDQFRTLGVLFRQTDPVDFRVARGKLPADKPDASGADDGKANAFGFFRCHGLRTCLLLRKHEGPAESRIV